jgi:hypothetical protein
MYVQFMHLISNAIFIIVVRYMSVNNASEYKQNSKNGHVHVCDNYY